MFSVVSTSADTIASPRHRFLAGWLQNKCEQIIRKLPNFKEYLELPEYETLVRLLEKGIGIHHSGMIPILREIVEIKAKNLEPSYLNYRAGGMRL